MAVVAVVAAAAVVRDCFTARNCYIGMTLVNVCSQPMIYIYIYIYFVYIDTYWLLARKGFRARSFLIRQKKIASSLLLLGKAARPSLRSFFRFPHFVPEFLSGFGSSPQMHSIFPTRSVYTFL